MRWPLSSRIGRPPPRPRALPVCARDRVEQFGDAGRPGRADVARGQDIFGRNVADDRPARPLADDGDFFLAEALGLVNDRYFVGRDRCRIGGRGGFLRTERRREDEAERGTGEEEWGSMHRA